MLRQAKTTRILPRKLNKAAGLIPAALLSSNLLSPYGSCKRLLPLIKRAVDEQVFGSCKRVELTTRLQDTSASRKYNDRCTV